MMARKRRKAHIANSLDTIANGGALMAHPEISLATIPDFGTPELRKQHDVVFEGDSRTDAQGEDSHHLRVTDQREIDRLRLPWGRRSACIDFRKFQAAERLLRDFTRAGMEPRLIINLGKETRGTGGRDWTPKQLEARENTNDALKAIAPLNDIVWDIVLCDNSLTTVEIARSWRPGTAFVVLDMALESLARHYKIGRDDG